jgi:hypothetical protein
VFQYTIQAGETDSDGISIEANVLALNSGTIRDAAGNNATLTHSAVSANTSYKVDTTAPTANFTKANDNVGTITGDFTSDNTTDDTALVLSGTNESGSSVKVYNGSTELGSATVSTTSWSYTATVVNGTIHQFNIKETDPAGNTSGATSNLAVTGDTTAPTVTFSMPGCLVWSNASGCTTATTFSPLHGTAGAGRRSDITITFSEAVYNLDGTDLTNDNVTSFITLNDSDGDPIDKDVTINIGNTIITIDPTPRLETEGSVYVAIGANVKDFVGNAITADNATFTTCKSCD